MDKNILPRLGKLPPLCNPLHDPKILKLKAKHLMTGVLPAVPAARDWSTGLPWDEDSLGNLRVGDCTVASIGHFITMAFALRGKPSPVTMDGVLAAYEEITGYMPGDPSTDTGAILQDVINYSINVGICGVRIDAFVAIPPEMVPVATELFGGTITGFDLPTTAQGQVVWDAVPGMRPGSWGGHAIFRLGDSPGIGKFNSWGKAHWATPAFEAACCDERYALLLADAPAPSGLNLDQLRADLDLLAG